MTTHIKPLIEGFLKKKKRELRHQERVQQFVDQLLNQEIKKHIQLKRVFKDQLVFYSDASSYTYDFNLNRENLLAAVRECFPEIKSIKVKTG